MLKEYLVKPKVSW